MSLKHFSATSRPDSDTFLLITVQVLSHCAWTPYSLWTIKLSVCTSVYHKYSIFTPCWVSFTLFCSILVGISLSSFVPLFYVALLCFMLLYVTVPLLSHCFTWHDFGTINIYITLLFKCLYYFTWLYMTLLLSCLHYFILCDFGTLTLHSFTWLCTLKFTLHEFGTLAFTLHYFTWLYSTKVYVTFCDFTLMFTLLYVTVTFTLHYFIRLCYFNVYITLRDSVTLTFAFHYFTWLWYCKVYITLKYQSRIK